MQRQATRMTTLMSSKPVTRNRCPAGHYTLGNSVAFVRSVASPFAAKRFGQLASVEKTEVI